MLQVTLSQSAARSRTELSDEEEEQVDPSVPGTSTGITHSSKPPPTKKNKSTAAGVADTLRDYLHERDTEAQEVKAEVDIHAFCTEIA